MTSTHDQFCRWALALALAFAVAPPDAQANNVFDATFLHKAYGGTLSFNRTRINHPFLDDQQDALLFVTPNWNPTGGSSVLELLNVGLWYSGSLDRWHVLHLDQTSAISLGTSYNVLRSAPGADAFVHVADVGNIVGNYTLIDHPSLNGDPDAQCIVTQVINPLGVPLTYNDHAIGVWYSAPNAKWAIFNQDLAAMPNGAPFNVMVLPGTRLSHLHTADVINTTGNRTFIDNAAINGNPDALIQVTQNWNPGGIGGTYNDHPIGVFYDDIQDLWAVTNMDGLSIPPGASFNILIPSQISVAWVDSTNPSDPSPPVSGTDILTHPLIDGELSPILLTTPMLDAYGFGTGYAQDEVALAYDAGIQRWYLRNQWGPSWIPNSFTHVYHAPSNLRSFVHQTGTGNIQYTILHHPLLDGYPDTIFFVQPHMNPADGPIVLIYERVGVTWFDFGSGPVWTVHNEPFAFAINDNAAYNIFIPPPDAGAFKHSTALLDTYFTVLDDPALNGNPMAVLLVTHNIAESTDQWLDKAYGTRFDHGLNRWTIATVDNSPIGDHTFNVVRVPEPGSALTLTCGIGLLRLLWLLREHRRRRGLAPSRSAVLCRGCG
jgi:hypothetical protein